MVTPKMVGLLVFEEISSVDLTGAAETFARATMPDGYGCCACACYEVKTVGLDTDPIATECGLTIVPEIRLESAPPFDTLIVPGSARVPGPKLTAQLARWLNYQAPTTRRIAALGTGIYPLAKTGLLDGRQVAAHWKFAKDFAIRFPQIRSGASSLFLKDGPFYTCAGGTSTIDFSLSLIEEDFGAKVALSLARHLVVDLKRPGWQPQECGPSQFRTQSSDRIAELAGWIVSNLHQDLSVEALAQRACMSRRNFTRVFCRAFGKTPKEFVSGARMAEARRRLLTPQCSITTVANSLGFKSTDVFSKTFERFIGIRPSVYRTRLGVSGNGANGHTSPEAATGLTVVHS